MDSVEVGMQFWGPEPLASPSYELYPSSLVHFCPCVLSEFQLFNDWLWGSHTKTLTVLPGFAPPVSCPLSFAFQPSSSFTQVLFTALHTVSGSVCRSQCHHYRLVWHVQCGPAQSPCCVLALLLCALPPCQPPSNSPWTVARPLSHMGCPCPGGLSCCSPCPWSHPYSSLKSAFFKHF